MCSGRAVPFSGFKGAEKKRRLLFTQGFAWTCGSMTGGGIVRRYVNLCAGVWLGSMSERFWTRCLALVLAQ